MGARASKLTTKKGVNCGRLYVDKQGNNGTKGQLEHASAQTTTKGAQKNKIGHTARAMLEKTGQLFSRILLGVFRKAAIMFASVR